MPLALFASAATARLVADYRFDGNLQSSVGGASEAFASGANLAFRTEDVAGCNRQVATFPVDQGVAIHTKDVIGSGSYTRSKLITGYVNGAPQFTYTDTFDQAVSPHPAGNVYFFVDNGNEESAGAIAPHPRLRPRSPGGRDPEHGRLLRAALRRYRSDARGR